MSPPSVNQSDRIPPERDFVLQELVDQINYSNLRDTVALTLQMKGLLVSGHLISAERYFTTLAENYSAQVNLPRDAQAAHSYFTTYADKHRQNREQMAVPEDDNTAYIHLENCTINDGSHESLTGQPCTLWRGRLAEVDAFFLSQPTPPPAPKA